MCRSGRGDISFRDLRVFHESALREFGFAQKRVVQSAAARETAVDDRQATDRGEEEDYARRLYDFPERDEIVRRVGEVAAERGASRAQVALAWLLGRERVTVPIVGSTKTAHLEDALGALELELTDEEEVRLEAPYRPREGQGHG